MRLPCPSDYECDLQFVRRAIVDPIISSITIDIHQLLFINSAGTTAIANLLLLGMEHDTYFTLIYTDSILSQSKNAQGFKSLCSDLQLKNVGVSA